MARDRKELGQKLKELFGSNIYFQRPPNIGMKYPCVVYRLSSMPAGHADNRPYCVGKRYQVTYITQDPDASIDGMFSFPSCRFDRVFINDNLYHYVFELYY